MKIRWSIAALILLPVLTIGHPVRTVSERGDAGPKSPAAAGYGRLPFSFEINQGQSDPRVKFLSRGPGYTLFLTPQETVLSLRRPHPPPHPMTAAIVPADHQQTPDAQPTETAVVRMQFVGANPQPAVTGVDPLPGKSHYFIGNDPDQWHTNIAQYAKVRYHALYPGIDLIYYGAPRRLEYDLVVAPGADPRAIRLAFRGVEALRLDDHGDLILQTPTGEVVQHQPVIYQEIEGRREPRSGHYRVLPDAAGHTDGRYEVAIEVAAYDSTRPLVIDPVLSYSTYLGGSGDDQAYAIAVDNVGSAFVSGHTNSTDFPPSPTVFPSCANDFSPCPGVVAGDYAFVARLDGSGTSVIYLTYLGGNGSMNHANGIAIDAGGFAYVTGVTNSIDFPVLNPVQSSYGGGASDAFATKLSQDGSALEFSTYLGGTAADRGNGIGVDGSHNIYVTGVTTSTDFPTRSGVVSKPVLQSTNGGGSDAFVAKLKSTGTTIIYSTYVGGSGEDQATAIAVDGGGIAYLTGYTDSPDFPLSSNPLQKSLKGVGTNDAFVSRLSAAGDAYLYSTYLGGSGDDKAYGIAFDSIGGAVVTGETASANDFPLRLNPTPLQPSYGGGTSDAFVSRLTSSGDGFVYSTYLGGSDADIGYSVTVGSEDAVYVTGKTVSAGPPPAGFPTTPDAFQPDNGGGSDAFVTELASNGQLTYSTYLGGDGADIGHAIGLDITDNIYIAGETDSANFPVMQPIQAGPAGGVDAFITKIDNATPSSGCNFNPKGRPDGGLLLLLGLAVLYGLRRRALSTRKERSLKSGGRGASTRPWPGAMSPAQIPPSQAEPAKLHCSPP